KIEPARFAKAYIDWMENIRDWCISRQIWWGHRIPVWYCDACGETFAALEDPTECRSCGSGELRQDPDVLDTWFSSQLWPFSTLGWPDETPDLGYFYPTSLMVTGYEILYLWIARMIFSGLYFMNDIPFREVLIHGIVRDGSGKKMSKSLGNVIDPLELIDRFGADALRFSLASFATSGNDVSFSEDRIEGARNFVNKLWNAARFVLGSLGDERLEVPADDRLHVADRWILSRLTSAVSEVDRHLEERNLAEAIRTLHRFVWSEYCDWYIELAKMRLQGDAATAAATKAVLTHVLTHIVRMLHPVAPFVTEELWHRLRPDAGSIMDASWPKAIPEGRDLQVEGTLERMQEVVVSLRKTKIEHGIPQGQRVDAVVASSDASAGLDELSDAIKTLARLGELTFAPNVPSDATHARAITAAGIEVSIGLGEVDLEAERAHLTKQMADIDFEIERARGKLANEAFVAKAPAAVVDKEKKKLEESEAAKQKLQVQLDSLDA
ncbi:MAG TPA: class I tRNA ligase family protein, partial [Actinomycetota bacterium]|nr:class I tRNA ligase family protein [Actinomycetota bacterium]